MPQLPTAMVLGSEANGYELEAGFQPLATVEALPISQGECALLRAALTVQAF
jgi:hypothetical protein